MTPTRSELLDRAYELRELYDQIDESEGLNKIDARVVNFLEDVIEELENAE